MTIGKLVSSLEDAENMKEKVTLTYLENDAVFNGIRKCGEAIKEDNPTSAKAKAAAATAAATIATEAAKKSLDKSKENLDKANKAKAEATAALEEAKDTNVGTIVGAIVGVLAVGGIAGGTVFYLKRRAA